MWSGSMEWIVILLVVVVLFGAGKIPKIAEDMGKAIGSFKKGLKDGNKALEDKDTEKEE